MGAVSFRYAAYGAVLAGILAASPGGTAAAQTSETLPAITVTDSRLGIGITGASSSIITREDLERAPQLTLGDILTREAGIQTSSLYGGVNGVGTTIDMRGFGITGPSNTLILIDGRRLNDWDLPGFDLSGIAKDSIERIEITRGNSGGVVYGDGAVGGVINIVTRKGAGGPATGRIDGALGSFGLREANASASASAGPFAAYVGGSALHSDGYRVNNTLSQQSGVGDFRYTTGQGSAYLNIAADNQDLRLPGPRNYDGFTNQYLTDRRGTNNPYDYSEKQGLRLTGGVTRLVMPGVELVLDGGARRKGQQAAFFAPFSEAYVDTTLWTYSLTPRLTIGQTWFGLPVRILTGLDYYRTDYESDRSFAPGLRPIHRYSGNLETLAGYWQQTVSVLPTTDIAFGGRLQRNAVSARDVYDPTAPQGFANPQGLPLDREETSRAYHLGIEHRFNDSFALFARAAQSFRVPNIDERIGAVPVMQVTDFDLQTQRSHDIEGGLRLRFGGLSLQSSVYDMRLTNELHFNPVTGKNENLDPTRRRGWETIAALQVNPDLRLRASLTYTDATFRGGLFAGNTVPVVSKWTGAAGLSLNIIDRRLVFDFDARHASRRYLDGNENNAAAIFFIPARTLLDARLGGEIDRFFWSVSVQNLLDVKSYDYALDTSFPGFPFVSFYPQPGRTFLARAGVRW